MARKRTGTIQMHGGQYQARHRVTIDGVTVRRWFPLGTTSKGLAKAKNQDLIARLERGEIPDVKAKQNFETFDAAFVRITEQQGKDGLKTWKHKQRRLRRWALPILTGMLTHEIKSSHVRDVLYRVVEHGKCKGTMVHVRNCLSSIFSDLVREEESAVKVNPCSLLKTPDIGDEDERPREVLGDDEFVQFMACELVPLEMRVIAMVARTLGGPRTGDILAWRWEMIDTVYWRKAKVGRSKTKKSAKKKGQPGFTLLAIPSALIPWLQAWWGATGSPTRGPVFPVTEGKRVGEHRRDTSFASALRGWLLVAGVTRHELHHDTEDTRKVDFHSFRRAYCSALADLEVNAQQAMKLAAHDQLTTHLKYVNRTKPLITPEGVAPATAAPAAPTGPRVGPYMRSAHAKVAQRRKDAEYLPTAAE